MLNFPRDILSEAQKGSKLVKELLEEMYQTIIQDEGEDYNKAVALAYGSAIKLVMDIETAQDAQQLKGGKQKWVYH